MGYKKPKYIISFMELKEHSIICKDHASINITWIELIVLQVNIILHKEITPEM